MIGRALKPAADGAKVESFHHDGPADYLKNAIPRPGESSTENGRSFTETDNFEQALDLARDGWAEGRARVEALTGGYVTELSGRIHREEWTPTVEGSVIDVAQFIEGEPECCRVLTLEESPVGNAVRHARILMNGTASCGVSTETIMARGAVVAALSDLLELAGVSVSVELVYACASAPSRADRVTVDYLPIKRSNERIDLNSLIFWTGHPSSFRRLQFSIWESRPDTYRKRYGFIRNHGYGYPVDPPLEADAQPVDIYLPAAHYDSIQWRDPNSARKFLVESLAALGVKLEKETA